MYAEVVGVVEKDELWDKMLAVKVAMEDADIPLPKEVADFFDDREPVDDDDSYGYSSRLLGDAVGVIQVPYKHVDDDSWGEVKVVDITKLPKGITRLLIHVGG